MRAVWRQGRERLNIFLMLVGALGALCTGCGHDGSEKSRTMNASDTFNEVPAKPAPQSVTEPNPTEVQADQTLYSLDYITSTTSIEVRFEQSLSRVSCWNGSAWSQCEVQDGAIVLRSDYAGRNRDFFKVVETSISVSSETDNEYEIVEVPWWSGAKCVGVGAPDHETGTPLYFARADGTAEYFATDWYGVPDGWRERSYLVVVNQHTGGYSGYLSAVTDISRIWGVRELYGFETQFAPDGNLKNKSSYSESWITRDHADYDFSRGEDRVRYSLDPGLGLYGDLHESFYHRSLNGKEVSVEKGFEYQIDLDNDNRFSRMVKTLGSTYRTFILGEDGLIDDSFDSHRLELVQQYDEFWRPTTFYSYEVEPYNQNNSDLFVPWVWMEFDYYDDIVPTPVTYFETASRDTTAGVLFGENGIPDVSDPYPENTLCNFSQNGLNQSRYYCDGTAFYSDYYFNAQDQLVVTQPNVSYPSDPYYSGPFLRQIVQEGGGDFVVTRVNNSFYSNYYPVAPTDAIDGYGQLYFWGDDYDDLGGGYYLDNGRFYSLSGIWYSDYSINYDYDSGFYIDFTMLDSDFELHQILNRYRKDVQIYSQGSYYNDDMEFQGHGSITQLSRFFRNATNPDFRCVD